MKSLAINVYHYSESFSVEPRLVLQKPYLSVVSAVKLAVVSHQEAESNRQAYVNNNPQYTQTPLVTNKMGQPTKMREEAVIPLGGLVENTHATFELQDLINSFK